ncbi:hypothetical protein ACFOD9_02690 [Novosphingobium bradum]|uniref:Uncharacterized protein n=1 Tax=Novosphingobium bradum TaxID=1737444 RepID=A0ABV7IR48_9SPHN
MSVAGTYEVTIKTPIGPQTGTMTVVPDGSTFTGQFTSPMGDASIEDGAVAGDTLTWKVSLTKPMPIALTCTATVSGDAIQGSVNAGAFGSMALEGTRKG